jgi:hypothetical protein
MLPTDGALDDEGVDLDTVKRVMPQFLQQYHPIFKIPTRPVRERRQVLV